jgi:hypothetical protein
MVGATRYLEAVGLDMVPDKNQSLGVCDLGRDAGEHA